jgi:parallel beta-helix repeat protein/predicted outer membrane repeat protein
MRYVIIILFTSLFLLTGADLMAVTIHVPGDEATIQDGIDAASNGDTVLVADGIYTGDGNHDIDFNGKAIVVMSENGYKATIIDCESSGRGFYFSSGEGSSSILRGFTIKNGSVGGSGGGVYCWDSSPSILECAFENNSAGVGGGLALDYNSMTVIEDCVFTGNYGGTYGGGMHVENSSDATISNCRFDNNEARRTGGGLRVAAASPVISECTFTNNTAAEVAGGGIHCLSSSEAIFINCTIAGNDAYEYGGGIHIGTYSSPTLIGCLIYGNLAPYGAGVFARNSSTPIFTNCTIADNQATAGHGGGISIDTGGDITVVNSIFWNDTPDEIDIIDGSIDITYSDIEGGWSGTGNIDSDPLFVGGDPFDYHLQTDSPCVDSGDPAILDACRPPGLGEERSDMGAYGGEENCGWLPPVAIANFDAEPTSGERPLTVEFTDLSTGSITSWSWDFGDGETSFLQHPVHTYDDSGTFSVSLTVSGPYGSDDTTMIDLIHVVEPPIMRLMVVPDSTAFPRGGELGFYVTATNNTSETICVDGWTDVTLPSGRLISPEAGPIPFTIGPDYTLEQHITRPIPPTAPLGGPYTYCVDVGVYPDSIIDMGCFDFDVVVGEEQKRP